MYMCFKGAVCKNKVLVLSFYSPALYCPLLPFRKQRWLVRNEKLLSQLWFCPYLWNTEEQHGGSDPLKWTFKWVILWK